MLQIARLQEAIAHDIDRERACAEPYLVLFLDREKAFRTLASPIGFRQIETLLGQSRIQRTVSICLVFPSDDDADSKDTIEIYRVSTSAPRKLAFIASRTPAGQIEYRLFDGTKLVLGLGLETFVRQDNRASQVLSLLS